MQLARLVSLAPRSLAAAALLLALAGASPALAAPDPLLDQQWALGGTDAIGAREAWARSTGAGVVVAVLDTGAQLDHPDLAGGIWTNPGEVPGNGVDDDHNGFVDDVHGANMFDGSANIADDEGHGTHVAGIIAARGGNGIGGAGIAPQARIMVVKVLDASRAGNASVLARGIRYAVGAGARILNVSINGDGSSSELDDAVRFADEHGATVVASAGNNGRDIDALPSYPASLPEPAILSVTASTHDGGLLQAANRGLRSVDLAAPGDTILSTARGSRYEFRSGTSMAAPFTAGALALLAAARPELSQADLRAALLATATRSSAFAGALATGRLDVGAAMHRLIPGAWGATAAVSSVRARLRLRTSSRPRAGRRATVRWSATNAGAVTRWRVSLDGRIVRRIGDPAAHSAVTRVARAGRHRWTVVGYDANANRVVGAARSFRALRRR